MRHTAHIITFVTLLLAVGCASTSSLPSGAKKVGGGLQIEWEAPRAGTAILIETTTETTVATESLPDGGSFSFDVTSERNADALRAVFPTAPTNAHFMLYFVPSAKKD